MGEDLTLRELSIGFSIACDEIWSDHMREGVAFQNARFLITVGTIVTPVMWMAFSATKTIPGGPIVSLLGDLLPLLFNLASIIYMIFIIAKIGGYKKLFAAAMMIYYILFSYYILTSVLSIMSDPYFRGNIIGP